ncbi:Nn.00g060750.m01.CDS01 [Neocucurbitaria sp. VM-36]
MDKKVWQWQRTINSQTFLISSDRALLPHSFIQEAFATEAMFWAKPISTEDALRTMLSNSLTVGLYLLSPNEEKTPIGMARLITDYTTLAYLTDVYLQPSYRALGLGKWMIHCCREMVLEIPHLRFMVLLTGSEQAQKLYRRELGMQLLDGEEEPLTCMGTRKARLADAAAAAGAVLQDGPSAPNAPT